MTHWFKNDSLFIEQLKTGHAWQALPATYFQLKGFDVEVPELKIRDNVKQAKKFANTIDLIVQNLKFEVKSRTETFTSPESFQYPTILIDTVSGYNEKKEKPFAYIMVSQHTGSMLFLRSDQPDGWVIEKKFDTVRKIRDEFYLAPKAKWRPLDELVPLIKEYGK